MRVVTIDHLQGVSFSLYGSNASDTSPMTKPRNGHISPLHYTGGGVRDQLSHNFRWIYVKSSENCGPRSAQTLLQMEINVS